LIFYNELINNALLRMAQYLEYNKL
jgi:hypothetical protein